MNTHEFGRLLYFSDQDLLTILREVPNERLLNALSGPEFVSIRLRICEVLSFNGARVFMQDLETFATHPHPQRDECQMLILEKIDDMTENGRVQPLTLPQQIHRAS